MSGEPPGAGHKHRPRLRKHQLIIIIIIIIIPQLGLPKGVLTTLASSGSVPSDLEQGFRGATFRASGEPPRSVRGAVPRPVPRGFPRRIRRFPRHLPRRVPPTSLKKSLRKLSTSCQGSPDIPERCRRHPQRFPRHLLLNL